MTDAFEQIVDLAWRQAPDAAIEAGMLPPTLWEDVSGAERQAVQGKCAALAASLEQLRGESDNTLIDAALYHLRCIATDTDSPVPGMLNHMTGPVARLTWAAQAWPSSLDSDSSVYLERLRQFAPFCQAVVGAPAPAGSVSLPVLSAFVRQVDAAIAENRGESAPLLAPMAEAGAGATAADSRAAREALASVIDSLLLLREHAVALQGSAVDGSPLAGSPDGAARYQAAIEQGTSLSLGYRQVEEIGRRLLDTTEARFAELAADPRVSVGRALEPDQALDRFDSVYQILNAALDRVIVKRPVMGCEVRALPAAHGEVGPPAYYGPSSKLNNRLGTLWVNTSPQADTREWEVLPLAMHEGVPGHHLQIALLDEAEDLPALLRLLPVNAFTEGWAVYSETLAATMNIEVGPAEEFGLLAHQRWRAGRLLVDVGLHAHGWSVAKATDVLATITRQDPHAVEREVVRYLAWPGQALGYAMGAEAIRRWVDRQLDAGSDLASTHSRLLSLGSVPLSVLDGGGWA